MDTGSENDEGRPGLVEATAQALYPNPIVALVLCRYTGTKPQKPAPSSIQDKLEPLFCVDRVRMVHPDEDCLTYYFMLDASMTSVREVLTHMSAPIVTVVGGDLTFRDIL